MRTYKVIVEEAASLRFEKIRLTCECFIARGSIWVINIIETKMRERVMKLRNKAELAGSVEKRGLRRSNYVRQKPQYAMIQIETGDPYLYRIILR